MKTQKGEKKPKRKLSDYQLEKKRKRDSDRIHKFQQKKRSDELAAGMSVRNAALEQLGYRVQEEECTTSIPDDPNCYIPSVCSSGYPSRSPSPNGCWSKEMVEAHKRERRIRQLEMEAKFAEDVAATIRSNQRERKEELAHVQKAGIAARARRARAVLNKAANNRHVDM